MFVTWDGRQPLTLASLLEEREEARKRHEAEAARQARREQEVAAERRREFEERRLTEADCAEIARRIHTAFTEGEREALILSFPSDFCTDGGRRINNRLAGWPETLPFYARAIHGFWQDRLQPGGFGFAARIVTFPGGMPGDVGLFVTWPGASG